MSTDIQVSFWGSPSSETVGFLKKCQKVDPPKIGHFRGGLLSDIFSKKHSKCLKMTLENRQKSGFYIVKFSKLQRLELAWVPQFFDQKIIRKCYLYVLETNGYVFLSISRLLLFFEFLQINFLNFDVCYPTIKCSDNIHT